MAEKIMRLLPKPKRPKRPIRAVFSVRVWRSKYRWVVDGPSRLCAHDEFIDALRDAWLMAMENDVAIAIHFEDEA